MKPPYCISPVDFVPVSNGVVSTEVEVQAADEVKGEDHADVRGGVLEGQVEMAGADIADEHDEVRKPKICRRPMGPTKVEKEEHDSPNSSIGLGAHIVWQESRSQCSTGDGILLKKSLASL